jgi:SAM-dependent methyltransferase
LKSTVRKFKSPLAKLLIFLFEFESKIAKKWVAASHKRLFKAQWLWGSETPEWFDHSIDLYYQWPKSGISFWVERGVFSSIALKGGNVLELCCGDGFNSKYFYSRLSKSIIAVDFDQSAINTACTKNSATNINFIKADIRFEMPTGKFDNIIWDAAIEHFTEPEIASLMNDIKARLSDSGILSGYTIVENNLGKSHPLHEYEFKNKEDLLRFIEPHFKNVTVFETVFPTRHNLYFWASDYPLPFTQDWAGCTISNS